MKKIVFLPILVVTFAATATAQSHSDDIVGRWMSVDSNLEVEVFKAENQYKARIEWFDDSDDKGNPMDVRPDKKNPNEALRSRKIIGIEALHGLVYNAQDNEWQGGRIYDPSSGKDWNAKAWLTKDGCLKVRGFWHFVFLGQNMCFKKVW
jgi:uncharacterized protein (DUF2147 family)